MPQEIRFIFDLSEKERTLLHCWKRVRIHLWVYASASFGNRPSWRSEAPFGSSRDGRGGRSRPPCRHGASPEGPPPGSPFQDVFFYFSFVPWLLPRLDFFEDAERGRGVAQKKDIPPKPFDKGGSPTRYCCTIARTSTVLLLFFFPSPCRSRFWHATSGSSALSWSGSSADGSRQRRRHRQGRSRSSSGR